MNEHIATIIEKLRTHANGRVTGFVIGNTSDVFAEERYYEIPVRETDAFLYSGVIVRDVDTAIAIANLVDGRVDYLFVDDEKKIRKEYYGENDVGNIEKAVRLAVTKTKIITYKGNDLALEATDILIGALRKEVSGTTVAIVGMGNLGSKIALRLVERGVHVRAYRRDQKTLQTIVNGLNAVKSPYTQAGITAVETVREACVGADIIIGTANEKEILTNDILETCSPDVTLIDAGKGTFAHELAGDTSRLIYRIDISILQRYFFYGLIQAYEYYRTPLGRKAIPELGETLISMGLLGAKGEVIVDSIENPKRFIGVSAGDGTLLPMDDMLAERIDALKKHFS